MLTLNSMERDVLKAFVEVYNKIGEPHREIRMKEVKFPKIMGGQHKLDVIRSLRSKGVFKDMEHSGINTAEQLTSVAIQYFNN